MQKATIFSLSSALAESHRSRQDVITFLFSSNAFQIALSASSLAVCYFEVRWLISRFCGFSRNLLVIDFLFNSIVPGEQPLHGFWSFFFDEVLFYNPR